MIVPPSPQLLLHIKDVLYSQQILRKEPGYLMPSEDARNYKDSFFYLDLGFMCINGKNPRIRNAPLHAVSLLSSCMDILNPEVPLFFGVIANGANDVPTALHFFELAAQRGNVQAMNAIGILYQNASSSISEIPINSFEESLKWFNRALASGSDDALKYIGELYEKHNNKILALHYFLKHFKATKSIYSAKKCAHLFELVGEIKASLKMNRICAAKGDSESVLNIIDILNENKDLATAVAWTELKNRYRIERPVDFAFSNLLSAHKSGDTNLPPFAAAANLLSLSDPFGQLDNTQKLLQRNSSVSYSPGDSIFTSTKYCKTDYTPTVFYPTPSRTRFLLLAFDFASADYSKRNLNLCSLSLQSLKEVSPKGICESKLWQAKCKNPRTEDYAVVGFISYLLQDYKNALEKFEIGSRKGCGACALMAGIMLFHGIGSQSKPDTACYYFSMCPTDPLALLHLGVACDDYIWIRRATKLLNMKYESGEIYEWAGDLFLEGVKIPQSKKIAQAWYGLALSKYKENYQDILGIVQKIKEVLT